MKNLFCIISEFLTAPIFSGCANSSELPRVTLVKYCADYDDYPDGAFGSSKSTQ